VDLLVNISVLILVFGIIWPFILFQIGKRATPKYYLDAIELVRIFAVFGYVFIIGVITISYLLGFDMGPINSFSRLLILNFIVIPIFLILCYLFGNAQFNVILNSTLYKYYKENKIIESKELREKIRKVVKRWAFLHYCLSFWRKNKISDVLKRVCPYD